MSLRNPDDNSPSKSRIVKEVVKQGGVEIFMEVRSAYHHKGTQRLGDIVIYANPEGDISIREYLVGDIAAE